MSRHRRVRARVGAGLCFAALAGASPPCHADGPWSGTLAATTDYVFRGVSQSYGGAALQGGINYQSPVGWFAGAWASNVDPYPFGRDFAEVNVYGGFGRALGREWTTRVTYTRYLYAWDHRPKPYDYGEFSLTLGFLARLPPTSSPAAGPCRAISRSLAASVTTTSRTSTGWATGREVSGRVTHFGDSRST
jgi:uncharacterized protein (TIGR02001 family)